MSYTNTLQSSGNLKEKLIRGDTDDEDIGNCILQLVYRKDGIVNLDFITLVAQNGEVANVSLSVCVCQYVYLCSLLHVYLCLCPSVHAY